jgi:hypothetical protein
MMRQFRRLRRRGSPAAEAVEPGPFVVVVDAMDRVDTGNAPFRVMSRQ